MKTWGAILLRRGILALLTLFVIVSMSFFMQKIAPGGPFDLERELPPPVRKSLEQEWLLNEPWLVQWQDYMGSLCSWPPDLKNSMSQPDYPVIELIAPRLAVSFSLACAVMLFSLPIGVLLGFMAARHRNRKRDHFIMLLALIGVATPSFVLGPLLKWLFALKLGWLPESRWVSSLSMILPLLSLSALYLASIARLTRGAVIEILAQDYIRAARARGLSEWKVMTRHAFPAAIVPVVAYLGPAMAGLAVGSVVIERIFAIPGLGNTFVDAAFNRDYPLVMGTVLCYSAILIALNFLSDIVLVLIDPRLRQKGAL